MSRSSEDGKETIRLLTQWGRPAAGLLGCAALALVAVHIFAEHPWRVFIPLVFISVVVLVALRFGMAAGALGGIVAALIFAYALFPPLDSFRVSDASARANLAWMLLGGVALSFLLLEPPRKGSGTTRRK